MTRLISAVFRRERDPSFLVEELKSIYDPNGGYFSEGRFIPSLAADIGLVVEKHLHKIGLMKQGQKVKQKEKSLHSPGNPSLFMICPNCNDKSLISQENCLKCINCGYSRCE
jgi:ribonucleoside-diphosphate reductase alpha chain